MGSRYSLVSMETETKRAPVSLAKPEIAAILAELPADADPELEPTDDRRRRLRTLGEARERLQGKTRDVNFGRDAHEAMIGSAVVSVVLSIAEVDALVECLQPGPHDAIRKKLGLLKMALARAAPAGGGVAAVAASVGLGATVAESDESWPRIVPVTVLTGCLGAGKTTVIRSLLANLPAGYTCAWLKNEYGDAGVDSAVAQDARISIKEIVNGCLCCTKVGELADALRALHELRPHRILVEASGSALPGPLVWEVEKLPELVSVDGVVTVVDCANFTRINNFSRTAKLQARTHAPLWPARPTRACPRDRCVRVGPASPRTSMQTLPPVPMPRCAPC